MRFSIWPTMQQPWGDVLEVAQHAEATGWDGVYVADHFMGDAASFGPADTPTLEATATLAALAGATERVRLGSLVFGMTYRHPAVLAKWATTVDHASGGRLVLGVGTGWQQNEHDQYGIRLGPPGERLARFDEGCQVLLGLLRASRTTVIGEHYAVTDAVAEPKPVHHLPVLIGGKGDRMLGLVARYADEWNLWSLAPLQAERAAVLDRRCERIGRDPATIDRSTQFLVRVTDDAQEATRFAERVAPRPAVAGPIDAVVEAAAALRDVGVGELILPDWALGRGPGRLERMDELIGALAAALR